MMIIHYECKLTLTNQFLKSTEKKSFFEKTSEGKTRLLSLIYAKYTVKMFNLRWFFVHIFLMNFEHIFI